MKRSDHEQLLWRLISEQRLFDRLEEVCRYDRIKGSSGLNEVAQRLADHFRSIPSARVRMSWYESDGRTSYGTWRAPRSWSVRHCDVSLHTDSGETLTLVDPSSTSFGLYNYSGALSQSEQLRLCLAEQEQAHGDHSMRAPANTVVFRQDSDEMTVRQLLLSKHYRGILTAPKADYYRNDAIMMQARHWHRIPQSGSETYADPDHIPFGISLTPKQGEQVRELLKKQHYGEVTIRGQIEAEFQSGPFPVLEVILPGDQPAPEYIVLTAHLCHPRPSAHDNASGVVTLVEIAHVFNSLHEQGLAFHNRRGLVLLFVPEILGTMAWTLERMPTFPGRILFGINIDMIGSNPSESGAQLYLGRPASIHRTIAPWILVHFLEQLNHIDFLEHPHQNQTIPDFNLAPFSIGSDHHVLNFPDCAIPSVSLGSWPDRFYHTDNDTIEHLSPHLLHKIIWALCMSLRVMLEDDRHSALNIIKHRLDTFQNLSSDSPQTIQNIQWFLRDFGHHTDMFRSLNTNDIPGFIQFRTSYDQHSPSNISTKFAGSDEILSLIPRRLYQGPLARMVLFEQTPQHDISTIARLFQNRHFRAMSQLAEAEMLIDGYNTINTILATLHHNQINLSPQLLLDTLNTYAQCGFIEFK
ncbi:DUF4910 domain-containing protein [bacterium]|nr:DUF4910 domain-containing protein [bacterium]